MEHAFHAPVATRSDALLRWLLDHVGDAILTLDAAGRVRSANAAAVEIFGEPGRHVADLFEPALDWPAVLGGSVPEGPLRVFRADGQVCEVAIRGATRVAADEVVLVACNLSEQARDRRRLKTQHEQLVRAHEDIEQLAGFASHDLQEPVRMIAGFATLLRQRVGSDVDPHTAEIVGYMEQGAQQLGEMVRALGSYSRTLRRNRSRAAVGLDRVWDHAVNNLRLVIEEKNALVTRDDLPVVTGDGFQLVRLFQNLVGNALKYAGDRPPRVHASCEPRGGDWLVSVQDNGLGIPSEQLERVFVMFQRLSRDRDVPGTGVGLAICRKIVERHGGRMWVESRVGEGSVFRLTLPAEQPAATPDGGSRAGVAST